MKNTQSPLSKDILFQAIDDYELISEIQKLVLKTFYDFNSALTVKTVCDVCNVSKQTASQAIKKLMKLKFLEIKSRDRMISYQISNIELEELLHRYTKKQELMAQMNKSNE